MMLTTTRFYFNTVKLGANESARVKFSTDYQEDIVKWPRTPSFGVNVKNVLTKFVCQVQSSAVQQCSSAVQSSSDVFKCSLVQCSAVQQCNKVVQCSAV